MASPQDHRWWGFARHLRVTTGTYGSVQRDNRFLLAARSIFFSMQTEPERHHVTGTLFSVTSSLCFFDETTNSEL